MVAGTAGGVEDGARWSVACAANNCRVERITEDRDRFEGVVVVDVPVVCREGGMTGFA